MKIQTGKTYKIVRVKNHYHFEGEKCNHKGRKAKMVHLSSHETPNALMRFLESNDVIQQTVKIAIFVFSIWIPGDYIINLIMGV